MHTPGPWYFQKSLEGPEYIIKPIPGDVVAVTDPQETEGQEEANARLIAAAPDMLLTLKVILKRLQLEQKEHGDKPFMLKAHIPDIEKVIAKAEGRL